MDIEKILHWILTVIVLAFFIVLALCAIAAIVLVIYLIIQAFNPVTYL